AYILQNSGAKVCFVMQDSLERAALIVQQNDLPHLKGLIQVGSAMSEKYVHFHTAVANSPTTYLGDESGTKSGDVPLLAGNDRTATLEDEALLVYTSGTTGAPKGVVLTQYNLMVDALAISNWHGITGNQRLMCVLPIHHVNGIVVTL